MKPGEPVKLANGRYVLSLHQLSLGNPGSDVPSLLLLHALGGSAQDWQPHVSAWPGAVHALDFAGHGESEWMPGGGYTPEGFALDADLALRTLEGELCLAGAGIGAYVALLLAGARAERIPAALLLAGRGFDGGGALPDFVADGSIPREASSLARSSEDGTRAERAFDPHVSLCEHDVRPRDYAEQFARAARRLVLGEREEALPPWLETTRLHGRIARAPARPDLALRELHSAVAAEA